MEAWSSHLISFLLGTATGAAGSYFATKYTDKRREKEGEKKIQSTFRKVQEMMPDLIQEMKVDYNNPEFTSVREFAILPNDRVIFSSDRPRFIYYEEQHNNLKGKVAILENHNFVYDVTPGNAPIYRITEEFWELVRKT